MEEDNERRRRARELIEGGDAREAFRFIRPLLTYRGEKVEFDDGHWRQDLEILARIVDVFEMADLSEALRAAGLRRDDPQALYDAGYALIEHGLHDIGATVLARANRIKPGSLSVIAELAAALENQSRYEECRALLAQWPQLLEEAFVLRYLLAFNTLLTGDVAGSRGLLEQLRPGDETSEVFMAEQLRGMVSRAEAVRPVTSLDDRDLRGWHFVLNGGFLLHISPYGLDEGMNGRYAYVQDSEDVCREGIEGVAEVLRVAGLKVGQVYSLAGRADAILAHAAARFLEAPVRPWQGGKTDPGLIVCYDLADLDDSILESFAEHRRGQILWAHAMSWTEPPTLAPDLVTFLYQFNSSPWGRRVIVDRDSGKAEEDLPRAGTVDQLAGEVLDEPPDQDSARFMPGLTSLVRASLRVPPPDGAGLFRSEGGRRRQWKDSPVLSNRFR